MEFGVGPPGPMGACAMQRGTITGDTAISALGKAGELQQMDQTTVKRDTATRNAGVKV